MRADVMGQALGHHGMWWSVRLDKHMADVRAAHGMGGRSGRAKVRFLPTDTSRAACW